MSTYWSLERLREEMKRKKEKLAEKGASRHLGTFQHQTELMLVLQENGWGDVVTDWERNMVREALGKDKVS